MRQTLGAHTIGAHTIGAHTIGAHTIGTHTIGSKLTQKLKSSKKSLDDDQQPKKNDHGSRFLESPFVRMRRSHATHSIGELKNHLDFRYWPRLLICG